MEYYIRPVKQGDAAGINALRRMPGVFENTMGLPSEREEHNAAQIAALDHASQHAFVAAVRADDGEERVIGHAMLTVYSNPRARHSGGIGIMVHRDYQGQGVGTRLLETLLDMADNWLMLVRVELGVYADNERAIRLYKRLGFEREGIKRMAAIRSGRYEDELMMARIRQPG